MTTPTSPEPLDTLIKRAIAAFNALSPEEQEAHLKAQRESWVRGEMALTAAERAEGRHTVAFIPAAPAPPVPEWHYDYLRHEIEQHGGVINPEDGAVTWPPVPEGLELLFAKARDLQTRLRAVVFIDEVRSDNQLGHEAADLIARLQAALAVAKRATLEEALAAVQKQRDTAAGHDGEAYLAGTYNGLDQACEIIRSLIPEPVSAPPEASALPDFTDANVQRVYEILCDLEQPPDGEHWEGYAARKIVAALSAPPEADND